MNQDSTATSDASGQGAIESRLRRFAASSAPGRRLPSTRELVAEHSASPITVQRVVKRLVVEGLVETRPGTGNFVARPRRTSQADYGWQTAALGAARTEAGSSALAATPANTVPLHYGYPSEELLPTRLVRAALARASRSASAVRRAPLAGLDELRGWFANQLAPNGGAEPVCRATADDVVIVPGAQSALSSIFRALAAPGDAVVMESPTYWGAIAAARQAGLRIIPVHRAGAAPSAADLDDAIASSGARLFYAQPHFANPTGSLWSGEEQRQILEVIRSRGTYLIEDDWAHDLAIDAEVSPLAAADADGHVIYIRSFTKSLSPSIRVAAVVARGPAVARIQADRTVDDLYVSGVLQAAALDVVTDPGWGRHLSRLRSDLATRRDELARHVQAHFGQEALTLLPHGGLNLWVRLPDRVDVVELARSSVRAGVMVAPGDDWFPAEPTGSFLRLNYSAAPPEQFEGAVATLARLL